MMRAILFIFFLYSQQSNACEVIELSDIERLRVSEEVYYGSIVSLAVSGYENGVEVPTLFPEVNAELLLNRQLVMDRVVTVQVEKTIKGRSQKLVTIPLSWCGGGRASFLEYVTIYNHKGEWTAIGELSITPLVNFNINDKVEPKSHNK